MKTFRRLLGFICLAISLFCVIMVVRFYVLGGKDVPVTPSSDSEEIDIEPWHRESEDSHESEDLEKIYVSPINFEELQERNPDIYAWLEIPGCGVSLPVLRNEEDEDFYLRRDIDGYYSLDGSLYTQSSWNNRQFTDTCTIIYGHAMIDTGKMFGTLQRFYSNPENFKNYNDLIVYLPDNEIHFKVFAAVPYNRRHILYYYDFDNLVYYESFIDMIYERGELGVNLDPDITFNYKDRLLILSTCLNGESTARYLVCGIEVNES